MVRIITSKQQIFSVRSSPDPSIFKKIAVLSSPDPTKIGFSPDACSSLQSLHFRPAQEPVSTIKVGSSSQQKISNKIAVVMLVKQSRIEPFFLTSIVIYNYGVTLGGSTEHFTTDDNFRSYCRAYAK